MKLAQFINNLKILSSINNISFADNVEFENIQNPKNFFLIQTINDIDYEINAIGVEFSFSRKYESKFVIKKEDEMLEDAPLYYSENLFLQQSSSFLLIELAQRYSENAKFIHVCNPFGIYPKIKTLFRLLIKESGYLKKLWLSEELGAFIIVNQDIEMQIVARNKDSLNNLLDKFGIETIKEESIPYKSNIILEGKINDNFMKGKIKFITGENIDISIYFDENSLMRKNIDKVIEKWNQIIKTKLSIERYTGLINDISKEIVEETYSQHKNKEKSYIEDKIQQLKNDLNLYEINISDNSIKLIFKSYKEYPNLLINCVFDEDLLIDECYFE
jgi:hypothetical protein